MTSYVQIRFINVVIIGRRNSTMLTANFLLSSSGYCLTLTEGKRLCGRAYVAVIMVSKFMDLIWSLGPFDELGNAEVDVIVVINLYIRSDRLPITLQQHCSYEGG